MDDEKIRVEVTTDEHEINDAVVAALASVPGLHTRNHQLVEVLWTDDQFGKGQVIRALPPSRTRELITTVCEFYRRGKDKQGEEIERPAHPPNWMVPAVHTRGVWPGLRPIVGVLEAPSIRSDGSIIQEPGYDDATGYVLIPSAEFPRVPERPTQDDARKALDLVRSVFADFPYATEGDRFAVIAAVLTVLGRPAISGAVPALILSATTAGSGKGLQATAIGAIAHGRPPAMMTFPAKEEEREKVLASYALRGAAIICFDNLAGGFGGASLDRCLTAPDTVELRVLGKSEIPELKWRSVVIATGNNPECVGDTNRRIIRSQLEPQQENPEERDEKEFKHYPLLPWILKERPALVVACLTILRAHALAGRPREGCKTWGSFEAWAEIIPPAIVWAGGADPMLTRPALDATADAGKLAAAELLRCWAALDSEGTGFTSAEFIRKLYPTDRRDFDTSDDFTAARNAVETLCRCKGGKTPDGTSLGYVLRRLKRRVIGGSCFDLGGSTGHERINRWVVTQTNGAGHGAHAGHVSSTPRERVQGDEMGNRGKTSPPSPPSPADEEQLAAHDRPSPEPKGPANQSEWRWNG